MRIRIASAARLSISSIMVGATLLVSAAEPEQVVNVHIQDVATSIARDIKVTTGELPTTVQAPVAVAAKVCDVAASVLAKQKGGTAECKAKSNDEGLNEAVRKHLETQRTGKKVESR